MVSGRLYEPCGVEYLTAEVARVEGLSPDHLVHRPQLCERECLAAEGSGHSGVLELSADLFQGFRKDFPVVESPA